MLQQADVSSAALLPLPRLAVELEELGAHLEDLLLQLLVGLRLDLLRQVDDGLELNVGLVVLGLLVVISLLGLGRAGRLVDIVLFFLLLLLGAAAEHGKDGRGGGGRSVGDLAGDARALGGLLVGRAGGHLFSLVLRELRLEASLRLLGGVELGSRRLSHF